MFVRIENYLGKDDSSIILNVEKITSIIEFDENYHLPPLGVNITEFYYLVNVEGERRFYLNKEQYTELCKILITRGK